MVLYHVITTYQLLLCMVHREVFHKNEKAYLLLPDFIKDKYPHFGELKNLFFDELLIFNNSELAEEFSREVFLDKVNRHFNKIFGEKRLKAKNFNHIYVAGAQGYFGAYLVNNEIPFHFIEEGCGLISQPEQLENIAQGLSLIKHQISKDMGLYTGDNKYVIKKICNLNAQREGFHAEGLEHFDVVEQLSRVNNDFLGKILGFFGLNKKYEVKDNSLLLLTQHFANLRVMSFEDQKRIYCTVIDYFTNDYNLIIKPHPDDLMYYESLFPDSVVIRERFPSELLPFVFSVSPEKIMTISSTAINSLKCYYDAPVKFSVDYEKHFDLTHKYYSIVKVIDRLIENGFSKNVACVSSDQILLNNIVNYSDATQKTINITDSSFLEFKPFTIIVADDLFVEEESIEFDFDKYADQNSVIIFPNSKKKFVFYQYPNKRVFDHIIPVVIVKQDYISKDETVEIFYVYSKNEEVRKMINEYRFRRELNYTKATLTKESLSKEEIKIKVLEGILEATEKRLEYYIQLEKELREQLKNCN